MDVVCLGVMCDFMYCNVFIKDVVFSNHPVAFENAIYKNYVFTLLMKMGPRV